MRATGPRTEGLRVVIDPRERFSDRVSDYVRYRPGYPRALRDHLKRLAALGPGRVVADVGSGTGIFARLLLETGASVIGVEPNAPMRAAAEQALIDEPRFSSRDGSAEATGLAEASVDLVTAAQAFHWFHPARARVELARISKPGGPVALVWNQRKDTPFNRAYEDLLERLAPDYANVRESNRAAEPKIRAFFAPSAAKLATFDNEQHLDAEGLRGRLTSSSYAPRIDSPLFGPLVAELDALFVRHASGGRLVIAYETIVWSGRLEA
jgi:ubiquinone/menaquinone biosynthesis C-methylase UbiE